MKDMICKDAKLLLSDYLDRSLDSAIAEDVRSHIESCHECRVMLDGIKNVVGLVQDQSLLSPPVGFSERLHSKLQTFGLAVKHAEEVEIGISEGTVPVGSHLIYFWQSNAEFEAGVRFLYPGLGRDEHCIIFGHDEALEHVQEVIRSNGYNPEHLIHQRKLTVLRRHAPAQQTIREIGVAIENALADGARLVRFLGNLGIGLAPLPAGEDDVLELETNATALMQSLPCVIVCMYDIRTVPGRLLFKGGLETHSLSVCSNGVKPNPFYSPAHEQSGSHHVN
jgi:hypothetical protein